MIVTSQLKVLHIHVQYLLWLIFMTFILGGTQARKVSPLYCCPTGMQALLHHLRLRALLLQALLHLAFFPTARGKEIATTNQAILQTQKTPIAVSVSIIAIVGPIVGSCMLE